MRLTWLIHDMQIWRIDTVHLTDDDGIWVETVARSDAVMVTSSTSRRAGTAPRTEKALTTLLTRLGLFDTDAEPTTAASAPAAD